MSEPVWVPLAQAIPTRTVRVPLDLRNPRIASEQGNSFFTVLGLTAHDFGHWEFVRDVQGRIYGVTAIPVNLAATPNAKIVLDLAASVAAGVTRMKVATSMLADGESLNPASLPATASQDITVPGVAYARKLVTFASWPLVQADAAKLLIAEITHEGAHANDTLAANTILTGAYLEIDTT